MYFDRFDICEAYYLAFSHCHGGQRSREYARMCAMARYFRPSPMLSVDSLSDNGREIYDSACARTFWICANIGRQKIARTARYMPTITRGFNYD